jgi:hypothetical protein
VKSKEEAIKWAKRCLAVKVDSGAVIEERQIFETSEFPEDAQKAASRDIASEQLKKSS